MSEQAQAIQAILDDHHNAARWRYDIATDNENKVYIYGTSIDSTTLAEVAIRDAIAALRAAGIRCRKAPRRLVVYAWITDAQIREALA